jgi:hypothetical protein
MRDIMAVYCETMDGPVVTAAELALEMENVNYVLPFVKEEYESELKDAFDRTVIVRELSGEAAEVADYWFFETSVRLHLMGKGKLYGGIKKSGIIREQIIQKAQEAVETGDKTTLENFLMGVMSEAIENRFEAAVSKKDYEINDTEAGRDYIDSMLDFMQFVHGIYKKIE